MITLFYKFQVLFCKKIIVAVLTSNHILMFTLVILKLILLFNVTLTSNYFKPIKFQLKAFLVYLRCFTSSQYHTVESFIITGCVLVLLEVF